MYLETVSFRQMRTPCRPGFEVPSIASTAIAEQGELLGVAGVFRILVVKLAAMIHQSCQPTLLHVVAD